MSIFERLKLGEWKSCIILLFPIFMNLTHQRLESDAISLRISSLFTILLFYSFSYYFMIKENNNKKLSWKLGAFFISAACILSPTFLQNDPVRYVWDGLNSSFGINPYKFSPLENPFYEKVLWAKSINHPELTSVYPPFAQGLFWMSTYLNPFFLKTYMGVNLPNFFVLTNVDQIFIGWKILIALFCCLGIYLCRDKRWEYIFYHPLFLYTVACNGHIDFFLLFLGILFVKGIALGARMRWEHLFLGMGILVKWLPLIFIPGFAWRWMKREGKAASLSMLFLLSSFVGAFCYLYAKGAEGKFLASFFTYSKNWYFFGFVHHILLDMLSYSLSFDRALEISKILCFIFVGFLFSSVFVLFVKEKIRFERWALFTLLIFYVFTPTLMPWYLLLLLPFMLLDSERHLLLWLWPLLSMGSKAFFYENKDPVFIRYAVYAIISLALFNYLKRAIFDMKKHHQHQSLL